MTFSDLIRKFLTMVQKIKSLNPAYKQPGDGSNGVCDCIGLIIGAVRRMGLKWTGIHGSNYAARYQTVDLQPIENEASLDLGDVVYKACTQLSLTHKWSLPDRYKKGRAYYNGDLKDYYHAGTVTQVKPLNITHMTSPHMKVDTKIGNWNYHGKIKPIWEAAGKPSDTAPDVPKEPENVPIPNEGSKAIVVAKNGKPVKMRQYPGKDCRTWEEVKCGTEVTIVEPGEEWAKIDCGRRKGWYMMAQFLDVVGDGKGQY